jgi:hypothetical protein
MGLASELRKAVVSASKIKGESKEDLEIEKPKDEVDVPTNTIWISDVLTRMMTPGKRRDFTFTLPELLDTICGEAMYLLRHDRITAYVFCFDQRQIPHPIKTRNAALKNGSPKEEPIDKKPYPKGTKLVEEGVVLPDGKTELIHVNRLRITEEVYDCFVRAILAHLTNALTDNPSLLGKRNNRIYVDYDMKGTWVYHAVGTKIVREQQTTCRSYLFSEADLKIAEWAYHFHEHLILVATSDTDFMIMFYHVVERLRSENKKMPSLIWWALRKEYYNMNAWLRVVEDVLGLDFHHYKALTLLNGTDYLDRNLFCRNVPVKSLICAMQELKKVDSPAAFLATHDTDWFDYLLRSVYSTALIKKLVSPKPTPERPASWSAIVCAAPRNMSVPVNRITDLFDAYHDNVMYWDELRLVKAR